LPILDRDRSVRVPCDVRIDGVAYPGAEVREKGSLGSASTLEGKPGFNVWFGRVRPLGLEKVTLNNCRQDASFLHEHLAYDLYRRAGLPGPRTAYATLTLNERPYGVYVLVEPVDDEFLGRAFGAENTRGNLYEGTALGELLDGARTPALVELKDEEKGRTRSDLAALSAAAEVGDGAFEASVSRFLNFPAFLLAYALDALLAHWDGPFFNHNNYYLYFNPADGRGIFLPHGMDQVYNAEWDSLTPPVARLAQRVRAIPDLAARWRAMMDDVIDRVWDVEAHLARIDQAAALLEDFVAGGAPDAVVEREVWQFQRSVDGMRDQVRWRHEQWVRADGTLVGPMPGDPPTENAMLAAPAAPVPTE
ncbi:MAG TPA: CotH kinase family protein, partial [Chloroflexota bacterium]|nr:CotH kinase family protein [Chloroflexota bacterium]